MRRSDSLSNSDASIVFNFQVDIRKNRVGNRDSVQWVRTWVQGEGKYGKTRGAHKWDHIERETGLLARGVLTLAADTAGV